MNSFSFNYTYSLFFSLSTFTHTKTISINNLNAATIINTDNGTEKSMISGNQYHWKY